MITITNLKETLNRRDDPLRKSSFHSHSTGMSTVSFSFTADSIEPTMHKDEYTEDERKATWYDVEDFRNLKMERRRTVKLMELGTRPRDSVRGLEGKTKEGSRQRTMAILNAVSAVLDQQQDQEIQGSSDPEALAQIYSMYSRKSQEEALERARKDQKEALPSQLPVS